MSQYYGTFWFPDSPGTRVVGRLTLDDRQTPFVELHEPPPGWITQGGLIPVLHAEVAQLGGVTLLHLTTGGFALAATYQAQLRARFAITGVWVDHDDNDAFIRRVQVALPVLEGVLPTRAYTYNFPNTRRRHKHVATVHPGSIRWSSGDVEVEWVRAASTTVRSTELTVRTTPYMNLTSSRPKSLKFWMDSWVYPVLRLLPILVGKPSDPLSLAMWQTKHLTPIERRHQVFHVYARGFGVRTDEPGREGPDAPRPVANADDINRNPDGLAGVIERFAVLESDHPVALPMLMASIYDPDRPLANRYIELTAALEAFDATRSGIARVSPETMKLRRNEVIEHARDAGLGRADLRFLKDYLPKRSDYSLETRIRRLHQFSPTGAPWTDIGYEHMARLRNAIAHGRETDNDELGKAYEQALLLARYLVLCELGMRRF